MLSEYGLVWSTAALCHRVVPGVSNRCSDGLQLSVCDGLLLAVGDGLQLTMCDGLQLATGDSVFLLDVPALTTACVDELCSTWEVCGAARRHAPRPVRAAPHRPDPRRPHSPPTPPT